MLIIQTPSGVFSAKNLAQNKKSTGSRLILANREEVEEPPPEEAVPVDPFSCARCRVFKRKVNSGRFKNKAEKNTRKGIYICLHSTPHTRKRPGSELLFEFHGTQLHNNTFMFAIKEIIHLSSVYTSHVPISEFLFEIGGT